MSKSIVVLLSVSFLLAGCAESPPSAGTQSPAAATVASRPTQAVRDTSSVWVEPPTGSHIGGGFARRSGGERRNDEPGLISAINSINQAGARQREQSFALAAVSQVSGLSQAQVLTLQNHTRLPLGDLLAFNTIARNSESKVNELAALKSRGQSWSALAGANGVTLASVAQRVRQASDLTASLYLKDLNNPARTELLPSLGKGPQPSAPGARPVGP